MDAQNLFLFKLALIKRKKILLVLFISIPICHFKVFRSNDFLFLVPYVQQPARVVGSPATLIDNIFMNSVEFVTVSGNLLCQLADHLLQFLVLKDFRVSYRPKHEQIFKRNYRFFNNNEFKNKINQIDWKTLFDSHDMN